jgi:lysophospholipase L1-like esterase
VEVAASRPKAERRFASIRLLLAASLAPPLLLAGLLAARLPGHGRIGAAVAAWALTNLAVLALARRARPWLPACLSLAALNLALLTPELLLRAGGFRFESGIQFGYPRPRSFARLRPDSRLFWTLAPGPGVNALGFAGPEVESPKPPGCFRVVFLSDSVGYQGYPAAVIRRLQASRPPPPRFEGVSLCQTGYSSHQGRVLAESLGPGLQADAVVVGYGWNDHWLAWGASDDRKQVRVPASTAERLAAALGARLRLLQAASWLRHLGRPPERPLAVPRVSLERYRENLGRIAEVFRTSGARVWLLTAASGHERMGVPGYLLRDGFAPDAAWVLSRHREYNAAVRALCLERGLPLVDLEAELRDADPRRLFLADGIHLTPAGLEAVAARVSAALLAAIDPAASTPASSQKPP